MGLAAGAQRGSYTTLSKPPHVGVLNHLWVVPYAGWNPLADTPPSEGAHSTHTS